MFQDTQTRPAELAQNVSKKNPRRTNYSSSFSFESSESDRFFSFIYMIRISIFWGPGKLIQNGFFGRTVIVS